MKIAVINDNSKKIKMWSEIYTGKIETFSHPAYFFYRIEKSKGLKFDAVILDRMYHEHDALKDQTAKKIRSFLPNVKIFLSSALHSKNEYLPDFDAVIDQWPLDFSDLQKIMDRVRE